MMNNKTKYRHMNLLILIFIVSMIGCSTPIVDMPDYLPPIVRAYKHLTLYNESKSVKTDIEIQEGDVYSVFASGFIACGKRKYSPKISLVSKVGESWYFSPISRNSGLVIKSKYSGELEFSVRIACEPGRASGHFGVDVIVWDREDYDGIEKFLIQMKEKNPENKELEAAIYQAGIRKQELLISSEITQTKMEIEALRDGSQLKKESEEKRPETVPSVATNEKRISDNAKQERVNQLESKLEALVAKLVELEDLRKRFDAERKKTAHLAEELEEKEKREKELLSRLKDSSQNPPVIVIAYPSNETKVEVNFINIFGVVEDNEGVAELEITVNGRPVEKKSERGLRMAVHEAKKRLDFKEKVLLEKGINKIKIRAVDKNGLSAERILSVEHIERRKNVWAVMIGINNYKSIRRLKYAVNDAKLFRDYLINYNGIPSENVTMLIDKKASLKNVRSILGTHLKNKAGKDDMVIIFFAGHGATEEDAMSPDGDGLEKYLLPYDADPKDLYATALPMVEISRIFSRIRAERLVFIVDSCYSGASGGRTIGMNGVRANISEAFFGRIASGKGRVLLSASGANEVSSENDELKNGIFTHHLIEGLKGMADYDKDGFINIDEVYRYVSEKVPKATGQEQHPIKKGSVEGSLVLGVVK